MAKSKSLRLDGVVFKLYIFFYNIIGEGIFKMRIIAIKEGHLFNKVIKGPDYVIIQNKWKKICWEFEINHFLIVSHKIFVNAL